MFTLTRYNYGENLTQGIITSSNLYICDSLELPWKDNQTEISCIPEGIYTIKSEVHPQKGKVIRIYDVPKRSGILIHVGNDVSEILGCILPGVKFGNRVQESKRHLEILVDILKGNEGSLEIKKI